MLGESPEGLSYGYLDTSGSVKEKDYLDDIINRINERCQGEFSEDGRVRDLIKVIYNRASKGQRKESLKNYTKKNDSEIFKRSIFPKYFSDITFELFKEHQEQENAFGILFRDNNLYDAAEEVVAEMLYNELRI